MGEASKIEWTDATWNPLRGCSRVSEGCRHCYAETMAARFSGPGLPYEGLAVVGSDGRPHWTNRIILVEDKLTEPLYWQKPRRIFVNSMSDLFHPSVPENFIDRVFAVMALCPQHTFQVLTKRPERMQRYMAELGDMDARTARIGIRKWAFFFGENAPLNGMPPRRKSKILGLAYRPRATWPLPNVWLGISVEDQKAADERIPHLLKTPAAVRFLSCEPLLGPIALTDVGGWEDAAHWWGKTILGDEGINWVIVGGESGPGARPMHPDWARSLRDQAVVSGVPFLLKQLGGYPNKRSGDEAILDGRLWLEFPESHTAVSAQPERSQLSVASHLREKA